MNRTFDAANRQDRILDSSQPQRTERRNGRNNDDFGSRGFAFLEWTCFERLERSDFPYNPDKIMVGWQLAGAYGINFYRQFDE